VCVCVCVCVVLGMEYSVSLLLDKHTALELHSQLLFLC
jgi:hypothetical protein